MEDIYLKNLSNIELYKNIKNIIKDVSIKVANQYLKKYYSNYYGELKKRTIELNKFTRNCINHGKKSTLEISIFERMYCLEHDLTDRPKCKQCNKKYVKFNITSRKYNDYCSYSCVNKNNTVKSNKEKTYINRYGVRNPFQSEEVKNKIKQTNLKKYGCENVFNNNNIIDKIRESNFRKYGGKSHKTAKSYNKILNNKYDIPLFSLEEYNNRINRNEKLLFKCKKCGNIFKTRHYCGYHLKCPICYPQQNLWSLQEKELFEYIKTIYNNTIIENSRNVISPYELDIYIPDLKLAIEYNGEYWHYNEGAKDKAKDYHMMKYNLCKDKDIKLIFIRERNWLNRQDDVKSFLLKEIREIQ